jgi:hypothetical protein
MPPADYLLKEGEAVARPILKSAVLATVHNWVGKFPKSVVIEKIVKAFSEAQVYDALKLLSDVFGMDDPKKRQDSNKRPKGEAFANDIHDIVLDKDNSGELPDIVVPSDQVKFCPVETVSNSDPGLLVRMARLEQLVMDMAKRPAAVQTVKGVQPVQTVQGVQPVQTPASRQPAESEAAAGQTAAGVTAPGRRGSTGGFAQAFERARSLSRDGRQEQGGRGREQTGSHPDSYAGRAAKRSRPGDVDSEGFRVPGRPTKKAVPKGCSTVDLSGMARAVVAPLDRYVGGINRDATEEDVREVLKKCATALPGGDKMVVSNMLKLPGHPSARTQSWKFTVPYSCRQLLDNPAMYPPGWTHRAYFAPRGDRNKRQKESGAGGAAAAPLHCGADQEALLREEMQAGEGPLELEQQEVLEMAREAEARQAAAAALMAA